jgi:hypothetical protein
LGMESPTRRDSRLLSLRAPSFRSGERKGLGMESPAPARFSATEPPGPFLSLRREEGVGDGESNSGAIRGYRASGPLPFAPARGRGWGWRVCPGAILGYRASGPLPFAPARGRGWGWRVQLGRNSRLQSLRAPSFRPGERKGLGMESPAPAYSDWTPPRARKPIPRPAR